jgi:ABC-type glycerol-3-phosphate transport system substrate-binding protein
MTSGRREGEGPTRRGVLRVLAGGAAVAPLAPVVLAACGSAAGGTGESSLQVSKPVTITAWYPVTTTYAPYLQAQTDRFQQANEKVKVTIEPNGTTDKLQTAIAGGEPPDLQQSNYIPMFMWAQRGALEAVDPYLDKRGKGDFFDWARDGSTIGGKLYEWPWMLNPTGPVINKSIFAEKDATRLLPQQGLKADWTFDQWKQLLVLATTRTGDPQRDVYGTAFLGTNTWYWEMMYLWGNGAEIYDKDEKHVVICSPQAVEGLQMLLDLVQKDRVAAPEPENTDATKAFELFYTKRIAILNGSNSNIGEVDKRLRDGSILPPFECMFMPPPHASGKKPAAFVAIQSFLVFKQDRDRDRTRGAMQLGLQLTDTPAQKEITSIGELPVRKSAGNIYADDLNRSTGFAVIDNGRSLGRFPENGEIRNLWQNAVQAVWKKEKSPKDALDELCRLSEPIMARSQAGQTAPGK